MNRRILSSVPALAVVAVLAGAAGCTDSTGVPAGSHAQLAIHASFQTATPAALAAAATIDRARVTIQRTDGRVVIDTAQAWPADVQALEFGSLGLALESNPEAFDITVYGYAYDFVRFRYATRVTLHGGPASPLTAQLQFVGSQLTAQPNQFVLETSGALTLSGIWTGDIEFEEFIGSPGASWTMLWAWPTTSQLDDTFFVLSLPHAMQVGTYQLQPWDPNELADEEERFDIPFAALVVEEAYTEFYERLRLYATTSGEVTVTSYEPATTGMDDGRVRGEVIMQATGYIVEITWSEFDESITVTETGETLSLQAAFDLPVYSYVRGTATVTVAGGPHPGTFKADWPYADFSQFDNTLYVDIWGSMSANVFVDVWLQLRNPALGTSQFSQAGSTGFLEYVDWGMNDYYWGEAQSGTTMLHELQMPASSNDMGVVRGTVTMSVPLERWTESGIEPGGTAIVTSDFHLPFWTWGVGGMTAAAQPGRPARTLRPQPSASSAAMRPAPGPDGAALRTNAAGRAAAPAAATASGARRILPWLHSRGGGGVQQLRQR